MDTKMGQTPQVQRYEAKAWYDLSQHFPLWPWWLHAAAAAAGIHQATPTRRAIRRCQHSRCCLPRGRSQMRVAQQVANKHRARGVAVCRRLRIAHLVPQNSVAALRFSKTRIRRKSPASPTILQTSGFGKSGALTAPKLQSCAPSRVI